MGLLAAPLVVPAWQISVSPNPVPGIGEPIGQWYFYPQIGFVACQQGPCSYTVNSANVADFMQYGWASVAAAGGVLISEGFYDGHVILTTQHFKANGLGFIMEYRMFRHDNGDASGFTPVTGMDTVWPASWLTLTPADLNAINQGNTITLPLNIEIRIQWIRLAGLNTSGASIPIVSDPANTRIFNVRLASNTGGPKFMTPTTPLRSNHWKPVHVYNAPVKSCTTPAFPMQTVNFGTLITSEFTHIGATPVEKPLVLTFTNCPQGYNKIGYYFRPSAAGLETGHPGVIKLSATSQASGFGIRILDANDQPIRFFDSDTNPNTINTYWIGDYIVRGECRLTDPNCDMVWGFNPTLPSNDYTVHLKAQLYQTEATVTPGKFNAALIIVMQYK